MNSLIAHGFLERFVDQAMLLYQPFSLESRRHDNQLPVIASSREVLCLN